LEQVIISLTCGLMLSSRPTFLKMKKDLFWRNLSKQSLFGLFILVGLGGAMIGFLSTWLLFWFCVLALCTLIKWIAIGFTDDNTGAANNRKK